MGLKLDMQRIKDRQARLRGEKPSGSNRTNVFWFPEEGTYNVRLLPWPDHPEYPFKELWFYYNLRGWTEWKGKKQRGKAPMALRQFNEDDPIAERIGLLRAPVNEGELAANRGVEEGTEKTPEQREEDLEFAKKLYASQTVYVPIIVRGLEDEGPKIWSNSSKKTYERFCELFLKDKIGETLLDTTPNGRDLEVKVSFNRSMPGNTGKTVSIDFDIEQTPLTEDEDKLAEWLENVPDPMQLMAKRKLSYEELEKRYQDWLAEDTDDDEGTEHTPTAEGASTDKTEATSEDKPKKTGGRKKKDMKAALADIAGKKG